MPRKVVLGHNDLLTRFPAIASQSDGWDPSIYAAFSAHKLPWICEKGHRWVARIQDRTAKGNGCPCCGGWAVIEGENDLQTKFPDIAKEAHGWNPSKYKYGSDKEKMSWICGRGHIFYSTINNRTNGGRGCPYCAVYGFRPGRPAWMYLMERELDQQIGITNAPHTRMPAHKKDGWLLVEMVGPADGTKVKEAEAVVKQWLKVNGLRIKGTHENWLKEDLTVGSLAEIAAMAGVDGWEAIW
jgi:hypothetical protein